MASAVATIQGWDGAGDDGSTLYVLRRDGQPDVFAHWPHPLREMAPDAVTLPTITEEGPRHGVAVFVGMNPVMERDGTDWRESDWMPLAEYTGPNDEFRKTLGDARDAELRLPGWHAYDGGDAPRDRRRIPGR